MLAEQWFQAPSGFRTAIRSKRHFPSMMDLSTLTEPGMYSNFGFPRPFSLHSPVQFIRRFYTVDCPRVDITKTLKASTSALHQAIGYSYNTLSSSYHEQLLGLGRDKVSTRVAGEEEQRTEL